jgi:hypothetical protein
VESRTRDHDCGVAEECATPVSIVDAGRRVSRSAQTSPLRRRSLRENDPLPKMRMFGVLYRITNTVTILKPGALIECVTLYVIASGGNSKDSAPRQRSRNFLRLRGCPSCNSALGGVAGRLWASHQVRSDSWNSCGRAPMARRSFEVFDLIELFTHWYAGRS